MQDLPMFDLLKVTTKKSFKFYNIWTIHENFNGVTERFWEVGQGYRETVQYRLKQKLKHLKTELRQLNNLHFQRIKERAAQAHD